MTTDPTPAMTAEKRTGPQRRHLRELAALVGRSLAAIQEASDG